MSPGHTGSRGTRYLGTLAAIGLAALVVLGLVVTPPEELQGDAVRLLYLHVGAAMAMYVGTALAVVGSIMWLWRRSPWWDTLAGASAEIAALFTAIVLVTGAVWGRPVWGVYWTWDARLTSTALLFLLLLGYLAIRRIPAEPEVRNKRAALAGLLAAVDLPLVHFSVEWWRSLHQEPSLTLPDTKMDDLMLFTTVFGIVVFMFVFLWLVVHRFRVGWLEDRAEAGALEEALQARRAEARLGILLLAFSDAGYVAAGYALTMAALGLYAAWILSRGRALSRRVPPKERRWMP